MFCCENCFEEKEIIAFVKSQKETGDCDFCKSKNINICSVESVGHFIRKGLARAYEHIEGLTGAMWDSDDNKYISADGSEAGDTLIEILCWNLAIFSDKYDEPKAAILLQEIMNASGLSYSEKKDGCSDKFENIHDSCLVMKNGLYGQECTSEYAAWQSFKYTCKHYNRYFDIGGQSSQREKLLSMLEVVFQSMKSVIDTNLTLIRARKFELKADQNLSDIIPQNECAPAPIQYATNNRMSPAGISYTYLADNISTCLGEIRTQINDTVLTGTFKPKKQLTILDLSIRPQIPMESIFSNNYNHDMNWIDDFVDSFRSEISKPILDDEKDLEYIPTQVLAEYIRKLGYDGIKFESSLIENTFNYVLFCGPDTAYSSNSYMNKYLYCNINELVPFTKWINLKNIQYRKVISSTFDCDLIDSIGNIIDQEITTYQHTISLEDSESLLNIDS